MPPSNEMPVEENQNNQEMIDHLRQEIARMQSEQSDTTALEERLRRLEGLNQ